MHGRGYLLSRVCLCACMCSGVLWSSYLEDLDWIRPVGVLPRCAFRQALRKHVQVENGVVFWVLDLPLKQFHDVQERVQGPADVYNCRQKNNKQKSCLSHVIYCLCISIFLNLVHCDTLFCHLSDTCRCRYQHKCICVEYRLVNKTLMSQFSIRW